MIEEQKVAALVAGSKLAQKHLNLIMAACTTRRGRPWPKGASIPKQNRP